VIGVQVQDVPLNALAEFGLKQRRGALVSVVNSGGPAANAGFRLVSMPRTASEVTLASNFMSLCASQTAQCVK
ncbi:MAG TPA: hypothetical protein VLL94_13835, partial [Nitrospiraceae bacterium]|nr:hypothetical protein [Nitrospiraceae bacterium]